MSRFLFVVPPLAGHVNPTVGVAAELTRRGHEIAWVGHPEVVGPLVGADAVVYPCEPSNRDHGPIDRPADLRGPAALKFLWEQVFIPLAEWMVPGVRAAAESYRPDAMLVDQQTVAGAFVGEQTGIPWATSVPTSGELTQPLAMMPNVHSWVVAKLSDLRRRVGGDPADGGDPAGGGDPRFSPYLVLAFTSDALTGPGAAEMLGARLKFVGPSITARPSGPDFPWQWLDPPKPTVLVTLGTVNDDAGGRFLNECVDAVAARAGLRAIVLDPVGVVTSVPANVLVRQRIPQLDLLRRVDAVVCHGGYNTVCESLYHDLPLVVAPIRDDQPVNAQQVVDAGAGVRIRFTRATAEHVGAAIDEVLTTVSYRENARRVGLALRAAGGAAAAADHLEQLVGVTARV